jgi:solute carrier family 25 protein 34/35
MNSFFTDFACGGLAAMSAITVVHPIDVAKSRAQFAGEGGMDTRNLPRGVAGWLARLVREEGWRSLYRGLPAAYALQFSVTATRFGTYGMAKSLWGDKPRDARHNFGLAALSGALGGVAGNPWFALKTRAQVYSTGSTAKVGTQHAPLPVFRAFANVYREEGLAGYFRGLNAFLPRVCVYGAVQLTSYDSAKSRLAGWASGPGALRRDGVGQHIAASVAAAATSVTAIQPFDFLAVRLQNQRVDPATGRGLLYSGPVDCLVKSMRAEGPAVMFKGFQANILRFCPYTILVFVLVEQFRMVGRRLNL